MHTPERKAKPLATPDQAKDLLREIGTLTTLKGKANTFSLTDSGAPTEVITHFPEPNASSKVAVDSVNISQRLDRQTGRPECDGTVATVRYMRDEHVDDEHTYSTHIGYNITTQDGGETYGMERWITSVESGPHTLQKAGEMLMRYAVDMEVAPDKLKAQQEAAEARLTEERAMGINDVYEAEAQQIIGFVNDLNKNQ
jgi:hypothetical protein